MTNHARKSSGISGLWLVALHRASCMISIVRVTASLLTTLTSYNILFRIRNYSSIESVLLYRPPIQYSEYQSQTDPFTTRSNMSRPDYKRAASTNLTASTQMRALEGKLAIITGASRGNTNPTKFPRTTNTPLTTPPPTQASAPPSPATSPAKAPP